MWRLSYGIDDVEFEYAIIECIKPSRTKKWKELESMINSGKVDSIKYSLINP
jgi:hypothetical protein